MYTAVSLVWAVLAVQAYTRGLTVANCGCFGTHLAQPPRWFVLVEDALLLLYAVLMLRAGGPHIHVTAGEPSRRHLLSK